MRLSIGGNENIVKVVSIEEHNKQIRAYERLKVIAEISREMHLLYGNEYEKKIRAEVIEEVKHTLISNIENLPKNPNGHSRVYDESMIIDIIEGVFEQIKEQK